jgi:hypothetical protein
MPKSIRAVLALATLAGGLVVMVSLGAAPAGASTASTCAAIKALPAETSATPRSATSSTLGSALVNVSKERSAVDKVVATKSPAVSAGYRKVAGYLSEEMSDLSHARALVNAKAPKAKIYAAITLANGANASAATARTALNSAVVTLCYTGGQNSAVDSALTVSRAAQDIWGKTNALPNNTDLKKAIAESSGVREISASVSSKGVLSEAKLAVGSSDVCVSFAAKSNGNISAVLC